MPLARPPEHVQPPSTAAWFDAFYPSEPVRRPLDPNRFGGQTVGPVISPVPANLLPWFEAVYPTVIVRALPTHNLGATHVRPVIEPVPSIGGAFSAFPTVSAPDSPRLPSPAYLFGTTLVGPLVTPIPAAVPPMHEVTAPEFIFRPPPGHLFGVTHVRPVIEPIPAVTLVPLTLALSDSGGMSTGRTIYSPTRKRFSVVVTDPAGAFVDPLSLRFQATQDGVLLLSATARVHNQVVRDSAGKYHVDIQITGAGSLIVEWESLVEEERGVAAITFKVLTDPIAVA